MEQYNNLSVTNGKEALEKIKYLTLNEPSGYGVYSTQLKDTIHYFIIKKELDELTKYKRAFEILKDTIGLGVRMEENVWKTGKIPTLSHKYGGDLLSKEEAELLEEVLKCE